ncbi:segregation and condensation protein A [Agaricicola taiwanensis]|uniref:Segregation and condensation protein A n=1 Tax=Agaricicola taiwanensis TaxID=591372 RepID=A0A8J2YIK3_9RHOB|nr:ScpA family protein [Agaricicola taiwanensis]GGE45342.1 segregation and condensation protein A [Agaricicola taiwanensis]
MSDTGEEASLGAVDEAFLVDVGLFEGPLDLLLDLARREKIDLAQVSIAKLAAQYLDYIEDARLKRLEIAAEYLVMAAWLAYLKSRLLLPDDTGDEEEPSAAELAENLARRLRHLQAIRQVADMLMTRPRLGSDVFARGAGEGVRSLVTPTYDVTLFDLLTGYARQREKEALSLVTIRRRPVLALADARESLTRLVGPISEWTRLDALLRHYLMSDEERRSVTASSFGALLEMVREGSAEIRQHAPFGPIYLRKGREGS